VTARFEEGRRTGSSSPKSSNGGGAWGEIRRQRRPSKVELGQDARGEAEGSCARLLRGRDDMEEEKQ
jgi:hypothetical protein